jgi:hypothetical protein
MSIDCLYISLSGIDEKIQMEVLLAFREAIVVLLEKKTAPSRSFDQLQQLAQIGKSTETMISDIVKPIVYEAKDVSNKRD